MALCHCIVHGDSTGRAQRHEIDMQDVDVKSVEFAFLLYKIYEWVGVAFERGEANPTHFARRYFLRQRGIVVMGGMLDDAFQEKKKGGAVHVVLYCNVLVFCMF